MYSLLGFIVLSTANAAQPQDISNSMSIPSADIVSQTLTADAQAVAIQSSLGVIYPTDGADFAELYTGAVGVPPESGTDLGAYGEQGDRVTFTVQLSVPPTANSALFDFYFLSAEYPEFVGTQYNDKFEANITGTAYTGNAATDSMGNLVDVNSAFFTVIQSVDLQGTGFENGAGGGTGWLTMIVPVDPGDTVTFSFTIYDVADGIYDSMVLLDNFYWSTSDIETPVIITPIILDYLSPKRSPTEGGIETTVYGEDLNGTCKAYFDGIESPNSTYVDATQIRAEVPPHAAGIVDVEIRCDGVQGTLSNSFTYFDDSDGDVPPEIISVDPYQIPESGGDVVDLLGSNFVDGAVVEIDGVAVATTFVSDAYLQFTAPAHATGFADVTVVNPSGLYSELSGGLYYIPVSEDTEIDPTDEDDTASGGTDTASDDNTEDVEGEGPKDSSVGGCSHFSSQKDGLSFAMLLLGVLLWRRK